MPYIMAVDLGGTNCRFAGFTLDKGILSLHRMGKRKTAELPDTGALISACGTALDRHPRTADAFVVGMAGPVADPLKARLTNAPLEVDLTPWKIIAISLPRICCISSSVISRIERPR